jgi:maltose alpha-D-glucosyltransferase/alpha-amylase
MPKKNGRNALLNDPGWYKDAVIYQVHVKSYFDSNNDGIGDFQGLIAKLDYIAELGVSAIWLLPFYLSPMRDDGYDIADYRKIEPDYGTMADVRQFIQEAHKRGLRIITELVINHTSDQHPWFQKARAAQKGSKARNYYVWSDTNQKYQDTRIIFSDTENSNWTWDPVAGQYFWHRFYSNQPDLNFDNPEVLKEVLSIMRFWFDMGVDGLRLDAIPYLVEREGTINENLPETHAVLKQIRAELDAGYPDRMLLAEANLWPEDILQYFGNGDECHMAFHFPLMPRMYMAIAQEDRFPIIDILRQMPDIPENCQWAIFLRNHDELTLEMVTDLERDYLWNYYANDKRARLNLGIRRRLAPLVERDRRRIELLNSLLLSMPGTPTIYYGDEIGMGDNIFLGDRHGVRTPMQWTNDRNGGFSRADPASLALPSIMDPLYGFQVVNVEAQASDAHSLLNWTRRMLSVRKQQQAFGRGSLKMLFPANRRILAYLREYHQPDGTHEIILCVANMSRAAQAGELDLTNHAGKVPLEMIGGTRFPAITKLNYQLTLPPYGFYWFLLADENSMPGINESSADVMPELPTIIIKLGLLDVFQLPNKTILENECIVLYLQTRNWFPFWSSVPDAFQLDHPLAFGAAGDLFAFAELEVVGEAISSVRYHLAMGFVAEHSASTLSKQSTFSRLRQKRTAGLLVDAFSLPEFNRKLIYCFYYPNAYRDENPDIQFTAKESLPELTDEQLDDIQMVSHHNALLIEIGGALVIKPVRTIIYGPHPFVELSDYLHERGYLNVIKVLGEAHRVDQRGSSSLAILQEHLSSQGDAWQWTQNTLERGFRDQTAVGSSSMNEQAPALTELENFARVLGARLGEMHLLLAKKTDRSGFGFALTDTQRVGLWIKRIENRLCDLIGLLKKHPSSAIIETAGRLETNLPALSSYLEENAHHLHETLLMRIHGNLHLGQILVVRDDAFFGCFDDPSSVLLMASRLFATPFKDASDILLSFDDAAAAAVRNISATDPLANIEEAQSLALLYRQRVKTAFYKAYQTATKSLEQLWSDPVRISLGLQLSALENRINQSFGSASNQNLLQAHLQELEERLAAIGDKIQHP